MLKLIDVDAGYGPITVLHAVNMEIAKGEIITLIGANGAGKTTTLMSVCGLVSPRQGDILLDGISISGMSPNRLVEMGICQVPEGRLIFPDLTVAENLDMGPSCAGIARVSIRTSSTSSTCFPSWPTAATSRRNAVGRRAADAGHLAAIMARPRLLLLDEPSLGLAPMIIRQIFDIIVKINQNGTTIFLVEQNAHQALKIAHRGYVMENGVITLTDTAANLLDNEDVKKAYLGI
jgi:branched-chain amino acid transport system ATP-binding protein